MNSPPPTYVSVPLRPDVNVEGVHYKYPRRIEGSVRASQSASPHPSLVPLVSVKIPHRRRKIMVGINVVDA